MTMGLQVWNSSGVQTLDVTDSITRIIDTFSISTSSGSGTRSYSNLPSGRTWVYFFSPTGGSFLPTISISGNNINWFYPSSTRVGVNVFVGVF